VTEGMRRTVLRDRHVAASARMADFAGWELPVSYEGTVIEHTAVREDAGVFDVSHLGVVWVTGEGADRVIDATFTNDPARLADGRGQYTLLCDDSGGIVDDLLVFRLSADRWLAMPNAANADLVVAALDRAGRHLAGAVDVGDAHGDRAVIAVQGPGALALVGPVLAANGAEGTADGLPYLGARVVGTDDGPLVVCRSGYTGERGVELVVPGRLAGGLWDGLVAAGATPCGLGARDTLRLEMGYPLHGQDLSTAIGPAEAGLDWAVRTSGRSFPGRDAIAAAGAPTRLLRGLRTQGRRPAREGMAVTRGGRRVGTVTSGTFAPTLGHGIALALLEREVGPGERVEVDVRGQMVEHMVVRPPFVDRDPR
jgi:aminomethyltransferase